MKKKKNYFPFLLILQAILLYFKISGEVTYSWWTTFTPVLVFAGLLLLYLIIQCAPLLLKKNREQLKKYYAAKDLKLSYPNKHRYGFMKPDRYYNFLAGQWMDVSDHKNFLNITYDIKVINHDRQDIEFTRFNFENGYFIGPVPPASVKQHEVTKFLPEQVRSFRAHEAVPKEVIDILRNIELEESRVAYQQSK